MLSWGRFGLPAQWHFSATSHGKGACDKLGGTVKHLAARASLQRPYDEQFMTPRQLLNGLLITYLWSSLNKREQTHLEEWFQKARTISGTRKLHSFVPVSKDRVRTRVFSSSILSKEEISQILIKVDPRTTRGHVYTLTQKESRAATEKLYIIMAAK